MVDNNEIVSSVIIQFNKKIILDKSGKGKLYIDTVVDNISKQIELDFKLSDLSIRENLSIINGTQLHIKMDNILYGLKNIKQVWLSNFSSLIKTDLDIKLSSDFFNGNGIRFRVAMLGINSLNPGLKYKMFLSLNKEFRNNLLPYTIFNSDNIVYGFIKNTRGLYFYSNKMVGNDHYLEISKNKGKSWDKFAEYYLSDKIPKTNKLYQTPSQKNIITNGGWWSCDNTGCSGVIYINKNYSKNTNQEDFWYRAVKFNERKIIKDNYKTKDSKGNIICPKNDNKAFLNFTGANQSPSFGKKTDGECATLCSQQDDCFAYIIDDKDNCYTYGISSQDLQNVPGGANTNIYSCDRSINNSSGKSGLGRIKNTNNDVTRKYLGNIIKKEYTDQDSTGKKICPNINKIDSTSPDDVIGGAAYYNFDNTVSQKQIGINYDRDCAISCYENENCIGYDENNGTCNLQISDDPKNKKNSYSCDKYAQCNGLTGDALEACKCAADYGNDRYPGEKCDWSSWSNGIYRTCKLGTSGWKVSQNVAGYEGVNEFCKNYSNKNLGRMKKPLSKYGELKELTYNNIKYNKPYYLQNQWGIKACFGSCGYSNVCGGQLGVGTYKTENPTYLKSSPGWCKIVLKNKNDPNKTNIEFGDTVTIQLQVHASGNSWFLVTCGYSRDCSNRLAVSIKNRPNNSSNESYWKIVSPTGKSGNVLPGDKIKLLNLWGNESYLNTCWWTSQCGSGKYYAISTAWKYMSDAKIDTSSWKLVEKI